MRPTSRTAGLLVISLAIVACASVARSELQTIHLTTSEDANAGMATRIDLVFVLDAALAVVLPTEPQVWFSTARDELPIAYGPGIAVYSAEVPPGSRVKLGRQQLPKDYRKASVVRAYVEHSADSGTKAFDLTAHREITLRVDAIGAALHAVGGDVP